MQHPTEFYILYISRTLLQCSAQMYDVAGSQTACAKVKGEKFGEGYWTKSMVSFKVAKIHWN